MVLLHDPALTTAPQSRGHQPVGFPYWAPAINSSEVAEAVGWAESQPGRYLVTMTFGSLVGRAIEAPWAAAIHNLTAQTNTVVIVAGASGSMRRSLAANPSVATVTDPLPLGLLDRSDVLVCHGGVGSLFAALRAGRPMVVLPQAFDQPWNARLVEDLHFGVVASRWDSLPAAVESVRDDPSFEMRAQEIGSTLLSVGDAVDSVVARILKG
jgi:UDP:flavonoid glycosyltransferase YjiC (YdhE family)